MPQVVVNLRQINRSWFSLALDQVQAARLLAPWPDLAERVDAPLDVRLRGTLGREWYGSGNIALVRGRVAGVEIADWRLPLDWAFVPALGSGQVDVRDSTGQLALGRVVSRASFTWGMGLRESEGETRFFGLELRPLVRQATELSQLSSGQVSGRFNFAGNEMRFARGPDRHAGSSSATDPGPTVAGAPAIGAVSEHRPGFGGGLPKWRICTGAQGVFRIDQLSFTGTVLQLFVDGTITLQGRLNLAVMANTENLGVNPTFLRFLGLRLPAVGPIPLTLLLEASTYFSNRLVHLRVAGTVRSPMITVEPLSLLTEEGMRFFVNRSNLPVP